MARATRRGEDGVVLSSLCFSSSGFTSDDSNADLIGSVSSDDLMFENESSDMRSTAEDCGVELIPGLEADASNDDLSSSVDCCNIVINCWRDRIGEQTMNTSSSSGEEEAAVAIAVVGTTKEVELGDRSVESVDATDADKQ